MHHFEERGVFKLTDGREYVIFAVTDTADRRYLYLATMDKPLKILFVEEIVEDGKADIRVLDGRAEKECALQLLQEKYRDSPLAAGPIDDSDGFCQDALGTLNQFFGEDCLVIKKN